MTVTSFTVGVVGTYYDYFSSVGTLKQAGIKEEDKDSAIDD
jgi:hypothetical protein